MDYEFIAVNLEITSSLLSFIEKKAEDIFV